MSENGFECLSAHFKLNIYCVIRLFCFNLKKKKEQEVSIRLLKCDGNMWLESKTLLQSWCGCLAFTKSLSISFFPWVHHCEKSALLVSKPGRAGDIAAVCMEVRERSSAQHLPTWPGSSVPSPQLGSRPCGAVDALWVPPNTGAMQPLALWQRWRHLCDTAPCVLRRGEK